MHARRGQLGRLAWLAAVGGLLVLAGCSFTVGASVLPTVDTTGVVGAEVRVTAGAGLSALTKKNQPIRTTALLAPVRVGGELRASPAHGGVDLAAGFAYLDPGDTDGDLGFRASALGGVSVYDSARAARYGAAFELAPLVTLWTRPGWDSTPFVLLGPVLEAAVWGVEDDEAGEPRTVGRFGLGVTLEWYVARRWAIGM
jgi:hypothetical protein